MKVASTLTNTAPDITGLPSLLSPVTDFVLPSSELRLPTDMPLNTESLDTDAVATFDAVLAMFGLPQNLPQPTTLNLSNTPSPESSGEVTLDIAPKIHSLEQAVCCGRLIANEVTPTTTSSLTPLPKTEVIDSQPVMPTDHFTMPPPASSSADPLPEPMTDTAPELSETVTDTHEAANDIVEVAPSKLEPSEPVVATAPPTMDAVPSRPSKPQAPVETGRVSPKERRTSELPFHREIPQETQEFTAVAEHSEPLLGPREVRHERSAEPTLRTRQEVSERQPTLELNQPTTEGVEREPVSLNVTSLTEQISAAMQVSGDELSAGGTIELHLRLDPPELGMVRVHLRVTDDTISIRFIAGDEAITRTLESQLPDLRQSLAERGLAFQQCDVMTDSRQQSSQSQRDLEPAPIGLRRAARLNGWSSTAVPRRLLRADRVDLWA